MMLQNSGKLKANKNDKFKSSRFGDVPGIFDETGSDQRLQQSLENDTIDSKYGFDRHKDPQEKVGWLLNMHPTEILDENRRLRSAVDYYFIEEDGSRFKVTLPYNPYLYVLTKKENIQDFSTFLSKKYAEHIASIEVVMKEDLDLDNHLTGLRRTLLKLSFPTVNDLTKVRIPLLAAARRNARIAKNQTPYADILNTHSCNEDSKRNQDHLSNVIEIREYDVPYHVRVSIDNKIFVGSWYSIMASSDCPSIEKKVDMLVWPDCIVLAFDIETTKLPLKFPDPATDQIMMISYMVDGQGYLITNREIISEDVEDFEYTPKPEFEGPFIIFNEQDEMALLQRFFDHITEIKPHIFVTYNGDFFDWPFVEARAGFHGLDMQKEIGYSRSSSGVYLCRAAIHMDCLCWVRRDSYLPVGSHGLKAVAKAKLRYDPVELDPEDMCALATEQPQVLSNYSVSDAVATYYLYMKYVHPFIFALCTIIPLEPDEVLRKGSGTLCEALLMVEAYHTGIIYPNKQESVLNKLTDDGHVLDQETYVGGHVEAIESGVFRADLPCRFRLVPDALQALIDSVASTIKFCIETEEKIPLEDVLNYDEVVSDIKDKLSSLKDTPCRLENPLIYHLDVGAMYPNIILTNRLQPSAMVDEKVCASCDFNKPEATCQRQMSWWWRGEVMPATRSEYQRIQQQLQMEKFPSEFAGGKPRAFHQLNKDEQAAAEKKRLQEYCRKAYKKSHVTRMEERRQTICQRENNFYVNTVLSFRDRRYEYKGLLKVAKKEIAEAEKRGDPSDIKAANSKAVLYDSLQLAHKCILNSFYGYVMRKGSRWFSMEMAGIVCYTGATIITKAREIVEQIGRPLELDTDGIWCILPASFPENFIIKTKNEKKSKVTISYPGAILNVMVQDHYTNHQYHDLVNHDRLEYSVRSENSIFFEVDGPYLSMILPASKEEGKKLKKRYAVFNFDGSLAELKGFEVKRRGELQLIKIFQSSVFEAFLKGDSLEQCYASVAKVADYWLDVMYSRAENMPDSELFDLISENRSMSRKLEDYGQQKSTSISTAKRLAEFLGDQMVKDAGLSCRFVISRKPDGAPVTERAVPLAIFQTEPSVKHHYLKRWLKDPSMNNFDIRNILDWQYYIERLSGAIQKIITIPAALQSISNPVPRVRHPDWLHKKVLEKNDTFKQRRITDMFSITEKSNISPTNLNQAEYGNNMEVDIEDVGNPGSQLQHITTVGAAVSVKRKRINTTESDEQTLNNSWRDVLGNPPKMGITKEEITAWINFHKSKWLLQRQQRHGRTKRARTDEIVRRTVRDRGSTLGNFLQRTKRTLVDTSWQIVQIAETSFPGQFRLWVIVGTDLHLVKLIVPRVFYVNQRSTKEATEENVVWRKVNKILPRSHPSYNLYEYSVPEEIFQQHSNELTADLSTPDIEGIYETQVPLVFRAVIQLGCLCAVDRSIVRSETDTFYLNQLKFQTTAQYKYMESKYFHNIFFYHHKSGGKMFYGLFFCVTKKCHVFVLDSVKSNQMPNMSVIYNNEVKAKLTGNAEDCKLPESDYVFDVQFETDIRQVRRQLQKALITYRDEKRGPTLIAVQSSHDNVTLTSRMPVFTEFPMVRIHNSDLDSIYNVLDWQRVAAKTMVRHFINFPTVVATAYELARYLHVPIGNIPRDTASYGADLFYARHLRKNNALMWCSPTLRPDLGGHEDDDNRLVSEIQESTLVTEINNSACYDSVSVELDLDALAVNSLLQAPNIYELEGTSSSTAFDAAPHTSVQDLLGNSESCLTAYDETARSAQAFRVLRQMVTSWLRDVSHFENVYADYQIVHFYRWLLDPHSLLYDPALCKTLNILMQKLFLHLVAEFTRLGSVVVFANFNKIIICTKKKLVKDAIGYVQYIVSTIQNKEIFHSLDIKISQCWEYMLWLDCANYGGIRGNIEATDFDETEPEDAVIEMNWNVAEYLTDPCQKHFESFISSFIMAVYSNRNNLQKSSEPGQTPMVGSNEQQSQNRHDGFINYAHNLLTGQGELMQKLFFITQRLRDQTAPITKRDQKSSMTMPESDDICNPVLQFVKTVCKVLSLDDGISEQVTKLRRDLLRLIGVGEFSPESSWKDPCASYTLHEVICKSCNHCRSIDLCKDPYQKEENGINVWYCGHCETTYSSDEIEHMLANALQTRSMAYVLQDLQCERCLEIKRPNMQQYCNCGGRFKTLLSRNEFSKSIKIFSLIAENYNLDFLKGAISWILQANLWILN